MNRVAKKLLVVAVVVIIAIVAFRFLAPGSGEQAENVQNSITPTEAGIAPTSTELSDDSDPLPEGEEKPDEGGRTSYRVKSTQVEQSSLPHAARTMTYEEVDWENEAEARTTLESALTGSTDDTLAVSELIRQCSRGFGNEQQIQRRLSSDSKRFAPHSLVTSTFTSGAGQPLQFENFAQYEEFLWSQFAQCESTRGMLDHVLRERLIQMARDGNVDARYLYATWVPDQGGGGVTQLIDWLTYQNLALDFTLANMEEGEPLGLLAYGRSLESLQPAYFTPMHSAYGQAFTQAAQKCGLNNGMINQKVANMTELWTKRQMASYRMKSELLSDQIMKLYCGEGR